VLTLPFTYGDKPAALSILSDLSERQASQRALEEAGRRYASLVESSSSGVVLLGGDIIEYANAGFARMLGFAAPADVVGSDMLMLTMPDFRRRVRHGILRLGSGLRQVQPPAQIRLRRQDGALIDVQVSASAITLAGRTLIQAELRDITRERAAFAQIRALNRTLEARIAERTGELTTANRELEATNRDLESFSYSVAHDLRAPLRSMMGFAQLLELDVASDSFEELPRHVARISKSAVRMNALIDGLLAVARVTHGVLAEDKVASAALVAEAIRELRPAGHVRFDIGGLPAVRGDTAALRQVWSNLISNAVKYSARAAQPEISVACDKSAGELVFRVSDNGAGFDPAHSARLFGVFQRLHGSGEFEGTGVGLAIVRRIVERHGGRCWAEGRPGAGASFYFALPAARAVSGTA
jgi:PAS domain S-box-containing protein